MQSKDSNNQSGNAAQSKPARRPRRDIDILFGSGTRVDVLWTFMQHPDEWLGPREIQRMTGRPYEDVRRASIQLCTELGLLNFRVTGTSESQEKRRKAVHRPFRLNSRHPLIKPLRMLFEHSIGALKVLEDWLTELGGIEVAFIFGSFAVSEQRPESDIDLVIIGKHTLDSIIGAVSKVEKRTGRELQVFTYSPAEWFKKVKAGDHFPVSLMEATKIFLVGDNAKLEEITG